MHPDSIVVTPGAKPFLFYGILATCNPGDEVIYPNPGFPIYESAIRWAGATPVPLPLTEETDFAFTADDLRSRMTSKTKMVILNSPANPTGGYISKQLNAEIANVLAEHDCWILSDEVYSEMLWGGAEHDTIAGHQGLQDRTILLDGFSKTFAMTGWRLGYASLPEALREPITRLIINSVSCTAPATQLAGVAALTGPRTEIDAMMAEFDRRRAAVVEGLNSLPGVTCRDPKGAFYAFPNVTGTGQDDTFAFGEHLTSADTIDGGAGFDTLTFKQSAQGGAEVHDLDHVANIEKIILGDAATNLIAPEGFLPDGHTLFVYYRHGF